MISLAVAPVWAGEPLRIAQSRGDDVGNPNDPYLDDYPDDYPYSGQDPGPTGDDRYPPRDGGDGNRWAIPAILAGVAALAALHSWNSQAAQEEPSPEERLRADERRMLDEVIRNGPKFPPQYNTSAFAVIGAARGGWPVVVDFQRENPGYVWLRVRGRGTDIYTYALHPLGTGRKVVQLTLPPALGETLRPVVITVMATRDARATVPLPDFRLYGLGCGPEAVGSVAINQLQFGPADIALARDETARYRFRTTSAFQRVAVEFLRIPDSRDGEQQLLVDSRILPGGTRPGDTIGFSPPGVWDGRDQRRRASLGDHRLRVRGWRVDGPWVGAMSDSVVRVFD